ncbi:aldehyde dehydrogenase family protein [Natrarchaeobius chitinivorans]|uniref:Aldehyde dehydrogenase n=1 Tax=Natrarchaeobius chitinivorans TaxID=1679083 RepID=A0A3N6P8B9_NATCH|nr:aldehyde dehydrogenase family protein [Natrarchaeobius chitinivorans]RQG94879.1 aldehyde dehydrogenase [Natrarchaeobius chitinivorans]
MAQRSLGERGYIVGGESRFSDETVPVYNPATNEQIGSVPEAGADGVDEAIEAAQSVQTEWAEYDAVERGQILTAIAERIREEADRIAEVETLEEGRPVTESYHQVHGASHYFEYYAGLTDKIEGEQIPLPGETNRLDYTVREPYGVTGHIVPWNASFVLAARSFGPALAAGNTVVAKSPSAAPISLLELTELAHEAGLPEGVLNTVTGRGSTTGDALVTDDRLDAIEFTGSTSTGKRVMKAAAERVNPVHLELGGKGANIVFEDADLEDAVESVVATYQNSGQICYAPTRIFVQDGVYEEFTDLAATRVDDLALGPGIDDPDMGPLIDESAQSNVISYVDSAVENGARVLAGGEAPDREGNFYEPTLVDQVEDESAIACDEIFGPVLTVHRFETASEAVERANDTEYGLNNVVWTNDLSRAHNVAHGLESGTVQVNEYPVLSPAAVSGGYKESGIGRSKGIQALESFTQVKNVIVSLGDLE